MKKWETPIISNLELDKTHGEYGCECEMSVARGEKHFCHHNPSGNHSGNHTNDSNPKPNDHFMSVGCPEHGNTCCCYTPGSEENNPMS